MKSRPAESRTGRWRPEKTASRKVPAKRHRVDRSVMNSLPPTLTRTISPLASPSSIEGEGSSNLARCLPSFRFRLVSPGLSPPARDDCAGDPAGEAIPPAGGADDRSPWAAFAGSDRTRISAAGSKDDNNGAEERGLSCVWDGDQAAIALCMERSRFFTSRSSVSMAVIWLACTNRLSPGTEDGGGGGVVVAVDVVHGEW